MPMFRCTNCNTTEFDLMLNPSFKRAVEISVNDHGDVVVQAGERRFVADLMFINRYGKCTECQATKQWVYDYSGMTSEPKAISDSESSDT